MEDASNSKCYSTNWGISFLCDCKKQTKELRIHKGIARSISARGVQILSDHQICQQKKVAMQLTIPSLTNGTPQKIIRIIGHSIVTIMKEGKFMTEIEFQQFEEDGKKELERNLHQRFEQQFFADAA
ncbi:MAG: hypothetical protein KJ899_08795 [Gammaproteobacteria bacterium]|nr:hypothetical protein [Gammaproteobacteria bacterium]